MLNQKRTMPTLRCTSIVLEPEKLLNAKGKMYQKFIKRSYKTHMQVYKQRQMHLQSFK